MRIFHFNSLTPFKINFKVYMLWKTFKNSRQTRKINKSQCRILTFCFVSDQNFRVNCWICPRLLRVKFFMSFYDIGKSFEKNNGWPKLKTNMFNSSISGLAFLLHWSHQPSRHGLSCTENIIHCIRKNFVQNRFSNIIVSILLDLKL